MDFPLINEINDNTNAAAEAVKTAILNAMPAAGIDQAALDAAVAEILAGMPTGGGLTSCIRKIQRGTATFNSDATSVTLSGFSALGKMVVIINGLSCYDTSVATPYITSLTTAKLTVKYSGDWNARLSSASYSYQVIEFY